METISNNVWQRRGSCVIFDQKSLGSFISDGTVVSLRQALEWAKGRGAERRRVEPSEPSYIN